MTSSPTAGQPSPSLPPTVELADTREQLIEQMARAKSPHLWGDFAAQLAKLSIFTPEQAEASAAKKRAEAMIDAGLMLPVAVKYVTDRVRALHYAAYQDHGRTPICPDCHGKAGTHPCGCWRDEDVVPVCSICYEGWKFVPVNWPCPTVRLLDEIDAEMGVEHA